MSGLRAPEVDEADGDPEADHPLGAAGQRRHRPGRDGQREDRRFRAAHRAEAAGQPPALLRGGPLAHARALRPDRRAVRGHR